MESLEKIKKTISLGLIDGPMSSMAKLTKGTPLEKLSTKLNADYYQYRMSTIAPTQPAEVLQMRLLKITESLLELVDLYTVFVVNDLMEKMDALQGEIAVNAPSVAEAPSVKDLSNLNVEPVNSADAVAKDSPVASKLEKVRNFFSDMSSEDSTNRKALAGAGKVVSILQTAGKAYNSVAQWLAWPQVPTVFLGK